MKKLNNLNEQTEIKTPHRTRRQLLMRLLYLRWGEQIMPMNFPDMKSLEMCAKVHRFREPNEGEAEEDYREALAQHVESRDFIEAQEIRNKVGWDKFTDKQNLGTLRRRGFEF